MSLQAKVVNQFRAGEHDDHVYQPGDVYPAEGYVADAERIAFLSEVHPKYKKVFLADAQEAKETGKKSKGKTDKDKEASKDKE